MGRQAARGLPGPQGINMLLVAMAATTAVAVLAHFVADQCTCGRATDGAHGAAKEGIAHHAASDRTDTGADLAVRWVVGAAGHAEGGQGQGGQGQGSLHHNKILLMELPTGVLAQGRTVQDGRRGFAKILSLEDEDV